LKIYSLELDRPDLACEDCSPPLPPTRNETFYESIQKEGDNINEARLVEMWFGPYKDTQALYVTKFGNHDTVLRIRYNGILNKPPKPEFAFGYDGVSTVNFDASLTTDPENDKLKYEWDFGDDSDIKADQMFESHIYSQPGEYVATLKVTDTSGQEQQVSQLIQIGTPPIVNIISPALDTQFGVGQVLRLKGEAVDFLGNPIPDDQLTWEVRQHHADHFHPFLDLTGGNDFDLYPAPDPEDYLAATNSFLKVLLTAEDSFGLTETVSVDVQPNVVIVNVTTQPPGLDVVVDGFNIETPQVITSWKGFKLPVTAVDQPPYIFKGWSDGRIARTRKFAIYQKENEPLPQVQALFCSDLATQCESHGECCSGYCSAGMNGICAPLPKTLSPSFSPSEASYEPAPYVVVPDPPASDLEINVVTPPELTDTGRPLDLYTPDSDKKDILDEEELTISSSLTNSNGNASEEPEEILDILLEYAPYAAVAVALIVLVWFIATCKMCKKRKKHNEAVQYAPYSDEESESDLENGSNEYYYDSVKASRTSSTEESEHNPSSHSSPSADNDAVNNSDISLSFLVPESMGSGAQDADIENQDGSVPGSPGAAPVEGVYLMPPLSPSPSLKEPKIRCFDNVQEELNPRVEGMLEYRFDAASTSQSSLILPPQAVVMDQASFDEVVNDKSVSLSIPSPQKSVIQTIPETNALKEDSSFSESDESSEERDLGETSAVIESLVLSYFSEKAVNEDATREENISLLAPIPDTSDASEDEEMDEDERVLDLLLSADMEEEDLVAMNMEKEFLDNCPEEPALPFEQKHVEEEQDIEEEEADAEVEETESTDGSTETDNEVRSEDPTKLTEESSILSQLCVASTVEEAELPVDKYQFAIETISHDNSENTREMDLSPLKSPNLKSRQRTTIESNTFMSPEANYPLKETEETPETLVMYDADSFVLSSESAETDVSETNNIQSKATGMNLQKTFAASAHQDNLTLESVPQQEVEANQ